MKEIKIGEIISFGEYDWRVLDVAGDKALIMAEHIIDQQPYNDYKGDVTWADCSLREYLNNEFYHQFTETEQSNIMPITIKNDDNQWYLSNGGKETEDTIFLLSIEEVVCQYFGDSSKNLINRSAKQRYWFQKKDINNDKRRALYDGQIWWWWLRSPGRDNTRAVYIHGDGNVGIQGNGTYHYSSSTIHPVTGDNCGGVRPALWLKIK